MSAFITIHGNIGGEPQHKTLPSGIEVCEFTVAVNHWKGANKDTTTSWFRVTVFGKATGAINDWQKGDHVIVNGELELREYTAQDGSKRTSADLNGRNFTNASKMFRAKSGGGSSGSRTTRQAEPAFDDIAPF